MTLISGYWRSTTDASFSEPSTGHAGAKDQDLGRFSHHLAQDVGGALRKVVGLEHVQRAVHAG